MSGVLRSLGHSTTVAARLTVGPQPERSDDPLVEKSPDNPQQVREHGDGNPQKTGLDHGSAEGSLMELDGWTSPQMLRRDGASARSARARRSYDRIMDDTA